MENVCVQFRKNPKINPRTGGRLVYGKNPYLAYIKECGEPERYQMSINQNSPKSLLIPFDGKVLNIDILYNVGLNADYKTLINLCETDKEVLNNVCNSMKFWKQKFKHTPMMTDIIGNKIFDTSLSLFSISSITFSPIISFVLV